MSDETAKISQNNGNFSTRAMNGFDKTLFEVDIAEGMLRSHCGEQISEGAVEGADYRRGGLLIPPD